MASTYLLVLAILAAVSGYALYKHFKSVKKSKLIRPDV
ncbi:Uncharacterised protein [Serratia odorifera]|uniref:Uncharacterized protein n=1 Tax=Serratia odorifera TaxID=618 RepID=A0A447KVG3_SEROD|nr:Uncharacterised protein [Serratia odorifera]